MAFWQPVTQPTDEVTCTGCQYRFVLPAEEPWYYRLNRLLSQAYARHGLMPVAWALEMAAASRFRVFLPPVVLSGTSDASGDSPEIDILAVVDGDLVVGEVKTKADGFGPADVKRLVETARRLRADRVILVAVEGNSTKLEAAREQIAGQLGATCSRVDVLFAGEHRFGFETEPGYSVLF
jgi:hypothetical protein